MIQISLSIQRIFNELTRTLDFPPKCTGFEVLNQGTAPILVGGGRIVQPGNSFAYSLDFANAEITGQLDLRSTTNAPMDVALTFSTAL